MDPLTAAALDRAHAAISLARRHGRADTAAADLGEIVRAHSVPGERSAAAMTSASGIADLFASVVSSTPHANLLDALIETGAIPLTPGAGAMVATAITPADPVTEGEPIPVRTLVFDAESVGTVEATALVATSARLWRDPRVQAAVTRETLNTLAHSVNLHLLALLTNTEVVPGTGDGPAADLLAGLAEVPAASGFVIAASPQAVLQLALSPVNVSRQAGAAGGRLADGLLLVPVRGHTGVTIIPSNRIGFADLGVMLEPSGEALIDLRDDPSVGGSPESVSAFQRNLQLLRATREFGIVQSAGSDANGSHAVHVYGS